MHQTLSRLLYVWFALFGATNYCWGNISYYFKHLGIEDGMSQNSVMSVLQDKQGFMWFGTKDGLNRYDGIHFKLFTSDEPASQLNDCIINILCEDRMGCIWIGTDKGVCVYNPENETIRRFRKTASDGSQLGGHIQSILSDSNGNVWFAGWDGVYRYTLSKDSLEALYTEKAVPVPSPLHLFEDKNGTVWVGTELNGLYYCEAQSDSLKLFPVRQGNIYDLRIETLLEAGRELYLGTYNKGLFKLNKETREITPVLIKDEHDNTLYIHALMRTGQQEIWIGTETGLYIYNEETHTYTHLVQSYIDKFALSDNAVYSFCEDRNGGRWIGTYFGGVNYLPKAYTPFDKYYPLDTDHTISGKAVREFAEDSHGYIWIGTEDAGLNRFDPQTGTFYPYKGLKKEGKYYHNIHALQIDGEKLWVGTHMGGLYLLDLKTYQMKHYDNGKAPNQVFSLLKDRTGKLWLGTFQGVFIYDKQLDLFRKMENLPRNLIYDIKEDHSGNIWFAVIGLGAVCYNPVTGESMQYKNNPNDPDSISPKIIGLYIDKEDRVWMTSEGDGFYKLDREKGEFKHYTIADGLPNNVVYYTTEDLSGCMWFGTNRGLVSFNPETEEFAKYTLGNGLICNQFNYKSAFTSREGTVYMGTINGMIAFNPLQFKKIPIGLTPILTRFQIFNKDVPIGEGSPLKKSISLTKSLVLSYKENMLSFDVASLNYNSSEMYAYAYQLEGVNKDWIILKEDQTITFFNLASGKYKLRVRIVGSENECVLGIIINPPFWLSVYAYIIYVVLILVAAYLIVKSMLTRINKRHKTNLELLNARKEKESYDAKITFFTNVAHEIRTPLSLIKAPLEQILKKDEVGKETKADLMIMQRNSDRLLSLINQLLDFRKAEAGKFIVNFKNVDIKILLKGIYERFMPALKHKKLHFDIHLPDTDFYADVDDEAFTKIISNLFTNAFKHSQTFISLDVVVDEERETFTVVLKNDGDIISEEAFAMIFEPFFQVNTENGENMRTGTGIGLSFARHLAELHGGKLYICQESVEYNTFVLELPIHQCTLQEETEESSAFEPEDSPDGQELSAEAGSGKPFLLVVDDNEEMLQFISRSLAADYNIQTACNGKDALELIEGGGHFNLIISDVAMPEMDGFELLRKVKSELKSSHIPVILLTARAGLPAKIEGLGLGADAYIEKPFSVDYLLVQIQNLLEGRRRLRESFIHSPYLHSASITITKADEEFMEKINGIVEKNMENIDFSMEQLTEAMNMSRSSLLRKVKGISGLTVNEYIRLIRLKKAVQLLEEGTYRINEICCLTGFNSPSYFAKCFQKQFGILPKEFTGKRKKDRQD